MAIAEELKVVIRAEVDKAMRDMKKFNDTVDDGQKKTKNFGSAMAKAGVAIGATVLVLRKAAQVAGELIDAYREQEQAEARLGAVLEATGHAAGFNTDQLKNMASGLQEVTTFGDHAIIGMQSVLATFRSIQGDAFERTTELALDLSAAFGQDLKSSAIQLGKALEDPATGLTALRRIGVSFTEEQQNMINAMTEAGDVAGAQAEILDTLEQQVGGVARAMADTATGEMDQFENKVGDLKEAIGAALTESVRPLIGALSDLVENMTKAVNYGRQLRQGIAEWESGLQTQLAFEAELRDIDQRLSAIRSRPGLNTGSLESDLLARRAELVGLIRAAAMEQQVLADNAEREAEAAAQAAADAAEKARIQAEIDAKYEAAWDRIQDITRTEADALREQIAYLEQFKWEDEQHEAVRLQALDILHDQLKALEKEAAATKVIEQSDFEKLQLTKEMVKPINEVLHADLLDAKAKQAQVDALRKQLDFQERLASRSGSTGGASSVASGGFSQEMLDSIAASKMLESQMQSLYKSMTTGAAQTAGNALQDIGYALASGADSAGDFEKIFLRAAATITNQIAGFALTAGLRLLAEGGLAMLPVSIALFALAGVAFFASGLLSGAAAGPSGLGDVLQDEIDLRQEYLEQLQDQLSLESDVLKDAWERNLISTDEFIAASEELMRRLNLAESGATGPGDRTSYGGSSGGGIVSAPDPTAPPSGPQYSINVTVEGDVYGTDELGVKVLESLGLAEARGLTPV